MSNDKIRFSYNWNNKLDNKAFTTIRAHNPAKYIAGKTFDIELNGNTKGVAILKEKRTIHPDQLNDFICYLDTGYSRKETINILQRMHKNMNPQTAMFDLCLLVYTKPNKPETKEIQQTLGLHFSTNKIKEA